LIRLGSALIALLDALAAKKVLMAILVALVAIMGIISKRLIHIKLVMPFLLAMLVSFQH